MSTKKPTALHYLFGAATFLAAGALVVPVGAYEEGEEDEETFEEEEKSCGDEIKACDTKNLTKLWGEMREECAEFRACKAGARDAKRACKNAARAKYQCRGKRGKAKRACKRKLRQEKRECRAAKRKAKNQCRAKMGTQCRSARNAFWSAVVETGKTCGVDVQKACKAPAKE